MPYAFPPVDRLDWIFWGGRAALLVGLAVGAGVTADPVLRLWLAIGWAWLAWGTIARARRG